MLVFTGVLLFGVSLAAFFVAHMLPAYRHIPMTDLASNARVVIGTQVAAYPIVFLFMFVVVRSRAQRPFGEAIHWNWPGISAPGFFVMGIILAVLVDGLSRYLPIPKSVCWINTLPTPPAPT